MERDTSDGRRGEGATRLPVLVYHHVGRRRPGYVGQWSVDHQRFEGHVQMLKRRGFESVSTERAAQWFRGDAALPPRPVMITFDDGFADLAQYAFPALRAAGLSALVFVVTGRIGTTSVWDAEIGGGQEPLLDESAIRRWSRDGIEFGSHTRTHVDLRALPADEAGREMSDSKRDLEGLVDSPADALAYPWGRFDSVSRDLAARHFSLAFGTENGVNGRETDPFALRRSMIRHYDSPFDISMRLRLGYSPKERLRRPIGKIKHRLLGPGKP